jgi:hypothetical protein
MTLTLPPDLGAISWPTLYDARASADQIQERLCDVLLGIDELRSVLGSTSLSGFAWIRPDVDRIYENVNSLMMKLAD